MAKQKYIKTPTEMWDHFINYRAKVKSNPFKVKDWVGKDGDQVEREKEKPLTMEGFECYLFEEGIISDVGHYFSNHANRYEAFLTICSHIKRAIRQDQIEGGMAGMYNASITQRLNGLVDKKEDTVVVNDHKVTLDLR